MGIALLLLGLQVPDLVEQALAESDPARRAAIVAKLKTTDYAEVEAAVRSPKRGAPPDATGEVVEKRLPDGSTYAIHVPKAYAPDSAWPVLVTLHGTNKEGDPAAGRNWIRIWLAEPAIRDRVILVAPTTTVHTWSCRPGHAIVLGALRAVQRDYRVDADRVWLDGASMGAGGAFDLAQYHPDRWAALAPRANIPDVRIRRDGTYIATLCENFFNVPVFWVLGAKDPVIPVERARVARDAMKAAGVRLEYREHAEGGHEWGLEPDADVAAWLAAQRRDPQPAEVLFKTFEREFARSYWVEILKRDETVPLVYGRLDMNGRESEKRTEFRPPAQVRAARKGNTITVTSTAVRELRIWLSPDVVDFSKPVEVLVNGRRALEKKVERSVELLIEEAVRRGERSMTFAAYVDVKVP